MLKRKTLGKGKKLNFFSLFLIEKKPQTNPPKKQTNQQKTTEKRDVLINPSALLFVLLRWGLSRDPLTRHFFTAVPREHRGGFPAPVPAPGQGMCSTRLHRRAIGASTWAAHWWFGDCCQWAQMSTTLTALPCAWEFYAQWQWVNPSQIQQIWRRCGGGVVKASWRL